MERGEVEVEYIPSFRDGLHTDIKPSFIAHSFIDEHDAKMMYGLPKAKKFPMPDEKHVRSAIRFFNYAKPSQEQELANAILARMDDFGIDPNDINVGDDNRFKKYLQHSYLAHHGIKGMHWGVRRYQNSDGSYTAQGKKHRSYYHSKYEDVSDDDLKRSLKILKDPKKVNPVINGNEVRVVGAKNNRKAIRNMRDARVAELEEELAFRKNGKKVNILSGDTAVTKRVKKDYDELSEDEFRKKYYVNKKTYAKRVAKSPTRDPYRDRLVKIKKYGNTLGRIL